MTPVRKKKKPRKARAKSARPRGTKAKARSPRVREARHAKTRTRRKRAGVPAKRAASRGTRAARPDHRAARVTTTKDRPALRVVGTRLRVAKAARPAPSAAFPQRAGASAKQVVLFEMIRARAALLSAIHGLTPAAANEPMGDGRWSAREVVLHLITRDQARLRESESTRHGQPASWKDVVEPQMGVLNAELMAPLRHLDWEDALRMLHRVREQLMEEAESVPEEPDEVWSPEHPFGWMLHVLPAHDRHHADSIKRWRVERAV